MIYVGYQKLKRNNKEIQLLRDVEEIKDSITLLDDHLDKQMASLPSKVTSAITSITKSTQESNHEFGTIAGGIAFGRLLINIGTLINTGTITDATAFSILGSSLGSAAYAVSRAINVSLEPRKVPSIFNQKIFFSGKKSPARVWIV